MRIAHLVLTHKNPAQLERLVNALDHPAFDFYIHIDGKSDITTFLYLGQRPNVFFVKNRTKIYWAGYGTIQATLNGFSELLPKNYDYVNVISGQDFPIKSADYIYQYIKERKGQEFMTCDTVGGTWPEAAVRMTKYHMINWRIPGKHRIEVLANLVLPKRKFPFDFTIVGRANWFTVTSDAASYMQQFIRDNPSISRFFKYSWGADEIIFATILYNSRFRDRIEDNLVYVDWRGRTDGHPKLLGQEDLPDLLASPKLFARKFDMDKDAMIFSSLENEILNKAVAGNH